MKDIRFIIAKNIRVARKKLGITQEELAERTGISYKYLQEIEGSNPPNIRVDTLSRLAGSMEISAWTLLTKRK